VLREAIAKHPESTLEQQTYWCARTGKSRASFYRTLARHNND
jgi:predicted DNA-binding transcriptional regulator AlpA